MSSVSSTVQRHRWGADANGATHTERGPTGAEQNSATAQTPTPARTEAKAHPGWTRNNRPGTRQPGPGPQHHTRPRMQKQPRDPARTRQSTSRDDTRPTPRPPDTRNRPSQPKRPGPIAMPPARPPPLVLSIRTPDPLHAAPPPRGSHYIYRTGWPTYRTTADGHGGGRDDPWDAFASPRPFKLSFLALG